MTQHLSDDALVELAEIGTSHPHLESCDRCRRLVEDAREMLADARNERVPEPSPLFWDHFSARVREAVANEAPAARRAALAWLPQLGWRPAVAVVVVALVVAGVIWRPRSADRAPRQSAAARSTGVAAPRSPASMDSQASAETLLPAGDPSLNVIAEITGHLDASAASDAGLILQPGASDRALSQLTASEQQELIRLLQADPDGPSL